jgi:hypothetical protein
MKAKTNLFYPNTKLEFTKSCLKIHVCLCISKDVYIVLKNLGKRCKKTKYRYTVSLIFATKDYSRTILYEFSFLLTQLMKLIREAKKGILEQSINNLSNELNRKAKFNHDQQLKLF